MKNIIAILSLLAAFTFISFLFASPTFAYTVKSGDTMTKIAKENNLTLQELAEANPQITNLDFIFIGQSIHTPERKIEEEYLEEVKYIEKNSYAAMVSYSEQLRNSEQAANIENMGQSEHTEQKSNSAQRSYTNYEKDLLARLVRAEAQNEPFEGKIAVACVVLNRVDSPSFPNTIREVIYAPGQFQPVKNGAINRPADEESIKAVNAALTEQRHIAPGALFFYNPVIATSRWLDSRATTLVIGRHVFKK